MEYRVIFTPEASVQLIDLYQYIAGHGAPLAAERYIKAIVNYCEDLRTFPHRGTKRDDLLPGLRIISHKKRTVIAFVVSEVDRQVSILGVFYGGQNYEELLQPTDH